MKTNGNTANPEPPPKVAGPNHPDTAKLARRIAAYGLAPVQGRGAVYGAPLDASVVNAATRLVECLAQPGDTELLSRLVVEEILIRLLLSRNGARVAQMGLAESSVHRVAKAISWLRANFSQPMKVESGQVGAHECFLFPRAF